MRIYAFMHTVQRVSVATCLHCCELDRLVLNTCIPMGLFTTELPRPVVHFSSVHVLWTRLQLVVCNAMGSVQCSLSRRREATRRVLRLHQRQPSHSVKICIGSTTEERRAPAAAAAASTASDGQTHIEYVSTAELASTCRHYWPLEMVRFGTGDRKTRVRFYLLSILPLRVVRPHRCTKRKMRPITTHVALSVCVCLSVCLSVCWSWP